MFFLSFLKKKKNKAEKWLYHSTYQMMLIRWKQLPDQQQPATKWMLQQAQPLHPRMHHHRQRWICHHRMPWVLPQWARMLVITITIIIFPITIISISQPLRPQHPQHQRPQQIQRHRHHSSRHRHPCRVQSMVNIWCKHSVKLSIVIHVEVGGKF